MFDFLKTTPYLYTAGTALFVVWLNIVTFYLLIASINGYKLAKSNIRKEGLDNSFSQLTKYNSVGSLIFDKFGLLLHAVITIFALSTIFMGAYTTNAILYLAVCYGDTLFRVLPQCVFMLFTALYWTKGATVVHGKLSVNLRSLKAKSRTVTSEASNKNGDGADNKNKLTCGNNDVTKVSKHAQPYIIALDKHTGSMQLFMQILLVACILLLDVVYVAAIYYQFLAV